MRTYQIPGRHLACRQLPAHRQLRSPNNLTQLATSAAIRRPPSFTRIFGPYKGKLKNSSASVKLYGQTPFRSRHIQNAGFVPYVLRTRPIMGSAPWPAQGQTANGASLQRREGNLYGNDPANWGALTRTPAAARLTGTITVSGISAQAPGLTSCLPLSKARLTPSNSKMI